MGYDDRGPDGYEYLRTRIEELEAEQDIAHRADEVHRKVMREAVQEVRRLVQAKADLEAANERLTGSLDRWAAERAHLKAENTRLREALEEIAAISPVGDFEVHRVIGLARAALEKEHPERIGG